MRRLDNYVEILKKVYSSREAQNIFYTLMEDGHGVTKMDLLNKTDFDLNEEVLETQVERLINNQPVQHITGISHFYGRQFIVSGDVLIPRPETEELVDWIVNENQGTNPSIWDIGTGSGCIAISLNITMPSSSVYGMDLSQAALKIAEQNNGQLDAKVSFLCLDVLNAMPELPSPDIIVSNPPYIPESERMNMDRNVTEFEPGISLFVPDGDALVFYRRIAQIGQEKLGPGGKLYFEIHENKGQDVSELLKELGYSDVVVKKDMQGKSRMVKAVVKP